MYGIVEKKRENEKVVYIKMGKKESYSKSTSQREEAPTRERQRKYQRGQDKKNQSENEK